MRVTASFFGVMLGLALPCAAAAEPLALDWDAPNGCPDEDDVEKLVSQRLGEHSTTSTSQLSASGRVVRTPAGFALTLSTPTGERRLESARCDELAQSAAVILALLIDPRAIPQTPPAAKPEPAPDPSPEPEPVPDSAENPQPSAAASDPRRAHGFIRAELVGDAGLLPRVGIGPGVAGGVILDRTTIELSGSYLPGHDVRDAGSDVGDLRAFIGRLGACQALLARPNLGPCGFVEYTRLVGRGDSGLEPARDVDATVWSLLAAARVSGGIGPAFGWMLEIGIGFPLEGASFKVGAGDAARSVHQTGGVVGRARAGIELRF